MTDSDARSPLSTPLAWLGLDRAALAHAGRLWIAAWLAFGIAVLLGVDNAYWAAMPIWVVAQPSRGLLFERGIFRVIGTLIGAVAGILILALHGAPWLSFALLGGVVGVSALAVHTLRGLHAYGAMLTGMTAAVVVLPTVLAPEHTLALAFARVECTLIGVVVVTVVTALFTPEAPREAFYRRVRRLCAEAVAHAGRAADGRFAGATALDDAERPLLAEISDIDANARLIAAGSAQGYRRLRYVDALVAAALAALAVARALAERHRRGETPAPDLAPALARLAARLGAEPAVPPAVAPLVADAAAAAPADHAAAQTAPAAPTDPLRTRLDAALVQLVAAEDALFASATDGDLLSFGARAVRVAPHRDWTRGRRAAAMSGGATFAAAILALLSGWAAGELAALGVCIFSMVLGSLPDPKRIARLMFPGVVSGVALALGYRFLIQPALDGTAALLLSVAPFLLLGALARASRRFAMPALDGNMCFLLASQAGMPAAGAAEILSGGGALVLAAGVVCGGFLLLPGASARDAAGIARRLVRDLRRLLPRARPRPADASDWHARTARQVLRLAHHLGRAAQRPVRGRPLLATLNLGHAIVALRELAADAGMDPLARQQAERAFTELRQLGANPAGVAAQLHALADSHRLTAATPLLLDAAQALADAAPLVAPGA
ncbi:FUSC family protein [Derxia lacustris]|uniref:FUSC family protein n=1 Tax=Derxia lacustris TaxID=764842 RepID=UPI000A177388|nr:FUSC family protein [Derxia lacustris]